MPGFTDAVGVHVMVVRPDRTEDILVICQHAKIPEVNFPLGIFPDFLSVLLIGVKNKFSNCGLEKFNNAEQVILKAIYIGSENRNWSNYICYSTLPFIYICDNELGATSGARGQPGKNLPVFDLSAESRGVFTVSTTGYISLDTTSGAFLVQRRRAPDPLAGTFRRDAIIDATAAMGAIATRYNSDFLRDGYSGGTDLLEQVAQADYASATGQIRGVSYGGLLSDVGGRWFKEKNGDNFNIGAALFFKRAYRTLNDGVVCYLDVLKSLNIKSVNKAAHAEVRLSLVLDFLNACQSRKNSGQEFTVNCLPDKWNSPRGLARVMAQFDTLNRMAGGFVLFSSLLPCYMCAGTIETTSVGYVTSINGNDVELYSSFPGTTSVYHICDTEYYDVDENIQYRDLQVYSAVPGNTVNIIQISPIYIEMFVSRNISISSKLLKSVEISSVAVYDAGSKIYGVGLQNNETAIRYMESGYIMRDFNETQSAQVVASAR